MVEKPFDNDHVDGESVDNEALIGWPKDQVWLEEGQVHQVVVQLGPPVTHIGRGRSFL